MYQEDSIPKQQTAIYLFLLTRNSLISIESMDNISEDGFIECVIFTAYVYKKHLYESNSLLYDDIVDEYNTLTLAALSNLGLKEKVGDFLQLLNTRSDFYAKEFELMRTYDGYLPSKIYNFFFEKPLSLIPNSFPEIFKVMKFQISILQLISSIKDSVNQFNNIND
jgi:hypothetical protein